MEAPSSASSKPSVATGAAINKAPATQTNKAGTGSASSSNAHQPDLTADVAAIFADYDGILARIEQENADVLAAERRIAASRKNMTRTFDDMAKARQRMATIFDKARVATAASATPPSAHSHSDDNDAGHGGVRCSRKPSILGRLDLERKRWDVMKRYEQLYRERKDVDTKVAKMEEKRAKDAEWIQGMFFRVAEKGLFEAPVIREKKVPVEDEEDEDDEGDE